MKGQGVDYLEAAQKAVNPQTAQAYALIAIAWELRQMNERSPKWTS